jgi:hypothetical protein
MPQEYIFLHNGMDTEPQSLCMDLNLAIQFVATVLLFP